jgi:hypothetical protein
MAAQVQVTEQPLPLNTSFSLKLPTLQIAWDSTSLSALKRCPRLYEYSIVRGYTGRRENIHFAFGIWFHAALEFYDRAKAKGVPHNAALDETVRRALIATWNFKLNRPWTSEEPTKTRETLIRAIVWYLDKFGENDTMQTIIFADGEPAVEKSFRFEVGLRSHLTDEEYLLCGHIDRLTHFNDRIWIQDRKTTKFALNDNYFDMYSPDNQVSLYILAGQVVYPEPIRGFVIDAVQTLVEGNRFQRGEVTRTPSQLDEWVRDLQYWLRQAEVFAHDNYWPQNDKACYGCEFRKVCGASPEVREPLLRGLFEQRVWDPLQTREV